MASWIHNGLTADVNLEAFPGRTFQGKVWRISPTVEQSKRTFIVEALIDNPKSDLKPGSYAKARIRTDKTDRIHIIPQKALNYVFGANKVYVVKDNLIEAREVKIGDSFGEDVEITEGLQPSEIVAVTQVQRLDTGSKVLVDGLMAGLLRGSWCSCSQAVWLRPRA